MGLKAWLGYLARPLDHLGELGCTESRAAVGREYELSVRSLRSPRNAPMVSPRMGCTDSVSGDQMVIRAGGAFWLSTEAGEGGESL
jgi:hypothetical protein